MLLRLALSVTSRQRAEARSDLPQFFAARCSSRELPNLSWASTAEGNCDVPASAPLGSHVSGVKLPGLDDISVEPVVRARDAHAFIVPELRVRVTRGAAKPLGESRLLT